MNLLTILLKIVSDLDGDIRHEAFKLFLLEMLLGVLLSSENRDSDVIDKCYNLMDAESISNNSKSFALRVLMYKLNLVALKPINIQRMIDELLKSNKIYDDEFFGVKSIGTEVLKKILFVVESNTDNQVHVLNYENFWRLIRKFCSFNKNCSRIYEFLHDLHGEQRFKGIDCNNFMLLLGLLDEISSHGAVGLNMTTPGDKEIIAVSEKAIKLTQQLVKYIDFEETEDSSEQLFALIQAITHQCMNPYKPIRTFAQQNLKELLNGECSELNSLTLTSLIDSAIEPLLDSLTEKDEKIEVLVILKDFYLIQYQNDTSTDEVNYPAILNIFNKYNTTNDDVEKLLQDLITEKKAHVI